MADKEISELTLKATPAGTDEFEIQETGGGSSKKATIASISDSISASILTSPAVTGDLSFDPGNGIDFSATSDSAGTTTSEVLDDYEEGTWTPGIADTTSNGSSEGQTYTTQFGRYVKIGRQAFITGEVTIASLGTMTTTEPAFIVNLPYTAADNNGSLYVAPVNVGFGDSLAVTAGHSVAGAIESDNGARAILQIWDSTTGVTQLKISELSAGGRLVFSAQYEV